VDGGKGSDTVSYWGRDVSVNVTLKGSLSTNIKVDGVVEDSIRNVESVIGGSAGDILKGDKYANRLSGDGGTDVLKGDKGNDTLEGGLGADSVQGGAGRDQFRFVSPVDAADHIKDFSHADDTIALFDGVFAAFTKLGGISSKAFRASADGHEAKTAKQKLIYDKSDGSLWYDADGKGAGAAVQIAVLDNKPQNLDFHDFLIV
ncbi:MAG: calcium-binding protein, partial [Devosia sp.]